MRFMAPEVALKKVSGEVTRGQESEERRRGVFLKGPESPRWLTIYPVLTPLPHPSPCTPPPPLQPYTEKIDVYSYGIVLYTLASNSVPFDHLTREGTTGCRRAFLERVAVGGERPPLGGAWPAAFPRLLSACWDARCSSRPTFKAILAALDDILYIDTEDDSEAEAEAEAETWTTARTATETEGEGEGEGAGEGEGEDEGESEGEGEGESGAEEFPPPIPPPPCPCPLHPLLCL